MMIRRHIPAYLVVLICTCAPLLASSIVLNGSFENPDQHATFTDGTPYYFWIRTTPLDFWTIEGPSLAFGRSRPPYWVAADGNQYLELESGYGRAIEQALATVPGDEYTIRFAYAPNPAASGADDSLNLLWDGVLLANIDGQATTWDRLAWTYHEYTTIAMNGTSVIRFEDGLSGIYYNGPLLDDVSVCASVPDPASLTLATIGLAALALRRRRGQ